MAIIDAYMLICIRTTTGGPMARVTINLPDDLHRAVKAAAARRGTTIGSMVAESLIAYGIKSPKDAATLVERARTQSGLSEEKALDLSVDETAKHRNR
jgi:plasmid stability protein